MVLEMVHLSLWELLGEPGGRAPLLGTLKEMPSKTLDMGLCFHRGPCWGTWRGFI